MDLSIVGLATVGLSTVGLGTFRHAFHLGGLWHHADIDTSRCLFAIVVSEDNFVMMGQSYSRDTAMMACRWGGRGLGLLAAIAALTGTAIANESQSLSLGSGFSPNPTILRGQGGGPHSAVSIVGVSTTPTGPCLGYISREPHQRITLEDRFPNLEIRVASAQDTTLVISGPGGTWCNDDTYGYDPAIGGEWLPGNYRIWVGAYRAQDTPSYRLYIEEK